MKRRILLLALSTLFAVWCVGCSSIAYVSGYNITGNKEIEVNLDDEHPENNEKYSETAHTIAVIETGGGYLRKSPTLIIGAALSPIFFVVGTISGALDPGSPPEKQEQKPNPGQEVASKR